MLALSVIDCKRAPATKATPRPTPNLLLITIDTLRADRVGGALTPTIDDIGRAGTVFADATAHVPLTLPSHTSILTGRYPTAHGVVDNAAYTLSADTPTLASTLHASGYHTAAFVASYVLRGSTGLARGFDLYDDRFDLSGVGTPESIGAPRVPPPLERRAPEMARLASRWIASAPQPFFAWVHFYDPHAPYDPPPAFAAKFPGRPYDAEVAAADFGVSSLLASMPAATRAKTVIVVTGDHGESLGEHGESEHGMLLYDATLHVPLVMQGPGVPSGRIVREQARHVDIVPTALKLAGVAAPTGLDGQPLFDGRPPQTSYAESRFGALHFGWSAIHSVRDGEWKYIDGPSPELYQLASDPRELTNVAEGRAGTAAGLAKLLTITASHDTKTAVHAPNADAAERLRSLGYVTGAVDLTSRASVDGAKIDIARYESYVKAFNDGLAKLQDGRAREAETVFNTLARSFPRAFEAHQYRARALVGLHRYRDALGELDAAIALAPAEPTLYFDAAQTLAFAGDYDRADARLREGMQLDPTSADAAITRQRLERSR